MAVASLLLAHHARQHGFTHTQIHTRRREHRYKALSTGNQAAAAAAGGAFGTGDNSSEDGAVSRGSGSGGGGFGADLDAAVAEATVVGGEDGGAGETQAGEREAAIAAAQVRL